MAKMPITLLILTQLTGTMQCVAWDADKCMAYGTNGYIKERTMSVLTGDLKVGAVQFHRGADLLIVQEAIDRLYKKYTEAMQKLGDHTPDLSMPAIPADHADAPGN